MCLAAQSFIATFIDALSIGGKMGAHTGNAKPMRIHCVSNSLMHQLGTGLGTTLPIQVQHNDNERSTSNCFRSHLGKDLQHFQRTNAALGKCWAFASGSSVRNGRRGSIPLRPTFLNSWLTRGYVAAPNIVCYAGAAPICVPGTLLGTTLRMRCTCVAGPFRMRERIQTHHSN